MIASRDIQISESGSQYQVKVELYQLRRDKGFVNLNVRMTRTDPAGSPGRWQIGSAFQGETVSLAFSGVTLVDRKNRKRHLVARAGDPDAKPGQVTYLASSASPRSSSLPVSPWTCTPRSARRRTTSPPWMSSSLVCRCSRMSRSVSGRTALAATALTLLLVSSRSRPGRRRRRHPPPGPQSYPDPRWRPASGWTPRSSTSRRR